MSLRIAKIAVENTVYHFDKQFDYLIPEGWEEQVRPGCRVLVPFGAGGKKRTGMVLSLTDQQEYEKLKPVVKVLDDVPLLTEEFLKMIPWLKERYFCTYYDAVKLILPTGLNYRMVCRVSLSPSFTDFDEELFS